jgi:UDP-apiose/xylose synthase
MKKIAILGCGGFIGSHLIEAILAKSNFECIGIDTDNAKLSNIKESSRFKFIQGDIYSLDETSKVIDWSDIVISLAAICNPAYYNTEPVRVIESNYDKPVRIVRECSKKKKWLIHFSTSEVYGKTEAALNCDTGGRDIVLSEESSHLILGAVSKQRWSYACAKQLLERMIYAHGFEEGLDYTIIRPFNFIGQRMDFIPGIDGEGIPRVIACFMEALIKNQPLKIVDGGRNKRVFTDIEDAVDAVLKIISQPQAACRKILNIGNPSNELSIRELAVKMMELYPAVSGKRIGSASRLLDVTAEEFYGAGYDDSDRRIPDITTMQKLFAWNPKYNTDDTLKRTMTGFVKNYEITNTSNNS